MTESPVGLAAAMYAKLNGAALVVLLGAPVSRLTLAAEMNIADVIVDIEDVSDSDERVNKVLEVTNGRGADVVVEATGLPSAVAEGMEMCRPNGQYLVLGQYTNRGPTALNPHSITRKQLKIYGSWAFAERNYFHYMQTLPQLRERFDLRRLVRFFNLDQANEALASVAVGECVKGVLVPPS